jgi:flagellar hook protein FlgE
VLRSMFSAISGLKAHQTKLDTVGNNIANVNTVGYKSSQTVFQDTLSQVLSNGSAPTQNTGGTNPAQVGLGVKVAGITTNFSQGSTQSTSRSTDFMISGDGFFVTQSGSGQQLYTRAGSLDFDGQGRLVTSDGAILQGWMAGADGKVDTNSDIGDLSVPYGQVMDPKASTKAGFTGNLSSSAPVGTAVESQITMYDALGNAHQITTTFTKSAANSWTVGLADENGGNLTPDTDATTAGVQAPVVTFNPATGAITANGTLTFQPSAAMAASWPQPTGGGLTMDLSSISQFGAATSMKPTTTDGYGMGTLQSFSLSGDGTIVGVYSNSLRQDIGKLALATFANPGGLEKTGGSSYRVGNNSGEAVVGPAGTNGAGTLTAGALEMSNVDLASEFTDLIIAQRGFQANSRVITTSDEVLQSLVNLGK